MEQNLRIELRHGEATERALARTVTSPECLSASVLTICQNIQHTQINEMIKELKQQTAAVQSNDLSRAEGMLIAQAHTLDGLFARRPWYANGNPGNTAPDRPASAVKRGRHAMPTKVGPERRYGNWRRYSGSKSDGGGICSNLCLASCHCC